MIVRWHFVWMSAALVFLVLGGYAFAILFGLAAWYCWPK